MFRLSTPKFGWWFGGAKDRWAPAKDVRLGDNAIAPLRSLLRNAKRKNVMQTQFLQQRYEKQCLVKQRLRYEKAYYKKWHYLKYCHQVIKHAMKYFLILR